SPSPLPPPLRRQLPDTSPTPPTGRSPENSIHCPEADQSAPAPAVGPASAAAPIRPGRRPGEARSPRLRSGQLMTSEQMMRDGLALPRMDLEFVLPTHGARMDTDEECLARVICVHLCPSVASFIPAPVYTTPCHPPARGRTGFPGRDRDTAASCS